MSWPTIAQMLAKRERLSRGRRHPGGCGAALNSGYCGLDWYDSNGKPVICGRCKRISKQAREVRQ